MSPLLRCAFPQSEIVDRDKHSYSYISKLQSTWNRNTGIFFLLDFRIFRIAGRIQPVQSHSLLYSNARTRLSLLQPNQQIKSLISLRNCHQKENSNLLMSLLLKRQRRLPSALINLQKISSDFLTASSQASAKKTSQMPLNTLKVSEHHLPNHYINIWILPLITLRTLLLTRLTLLMQWFYIKVIRRTSHLHPATGLSAPAPSLPRPATPT